MEVARGFLSDYLSVPLSPPDREYICPLAVWSSSHACMIGSVSTVPTLDTLWQIIECGIEGEIRGRGGSNDSLEQTWKKRQAWN